MPTTTEAATAVETTEAATHMAETSDMGDTHAVGETATPKMGDIYAAVGETVTSDMGDTYAAETHAVMDDAPIGPDAHMPEAVVRVLTIEHGVRQDDQSASAGSRDPSERTLELVRSWHLHDVNLNAK